MRGTLLLLSVGFSYPFCWLLFSIGYGTEGDLTAQLLQSRGSEPSQFVWPPAKCY